MFIFLNILFLNLSQYLYFIIKSLLNITQNYQSIYTQDLMDKPISMSMYSNYLVQVGKLVYIIGEGDATSGIKKLLETADNKSKVFYKCLNEVPANTFKKVSVSCRRKGIIRCDWIDKIIDKSPQMIIIIFSYTQQLGDNEKWQDRLGIMIRKINKIYEVLKVNNKQDIILKIVIVFSKQSAVYGNVSEKIRQYLKFYEKDLHVIQLDYFVKDVQKLKVSWMNQLERNYDRKYKQILKRMEESFTEKRIGCLVKLAILSEVLGRNDGKYEEVYQSLKFRYNQNKKNGIDINKYHLIRQIRTVADVIILRSIRLKLNNNNKKIQELVKTHLQFFKMDNMHPNKTHYYIYLQQLLWKCGFIQSFLQILHSFQEINAISKTCLAELVNAILNYFHYISQIKNNILNKTANGVQLQLGQTYYLGCTNYTDIKDITVQDIIYTKVKEIIEHKKDFIAKGIQLIVRYKGMKCFNKNQLLFLNSYLLKFYLADGKFQALIPIFNEVLTMEVKRSNYYLINQLFKEINNELSTIDVNYRPRFYSIAILICDYFQNKVELQKFSQLLCSAISACSEAELIQPISLLVKKHSLIFKVEVDIKNGFQPIGEQVEITLNLEMHKFIMNQSSTLTVRFNKSTIIFQNITVQKQIKLKFVPLDYFKQDEIMEISSISLITNNAKVIWNITKQQFTFSKYNQILVYTQIRAPQVDIVTPFKVYFVNETVPLEILIKPIQGCNIQAKFSVKQQDTISGKTQIFNTLDQRLNLTNSKFYQNLVVGQPNQVFMKLNKIGEKIIKFAIHVTVKKVCDNKGDQVLKNSFVINKETSFKVTNLFEILKSYKESPSGVGLKFNEIPINKKIMLQLKIQAHESVRIVEMNNHKNPKFFKYYKDINLKNIVLSVEDKYKGILIFEVNENIIDFQVFLATFYIKWMRIDMKTPIQNIFVDEEIKVNPITSKISLDYRCDKELRKKKKSSLVVTIRNLSANQVHFYSEIQSTEYLMRIGQKGKSVILAAKQCKSLFFDVLPVKSGYWKSPTLRAIIDGVQQKQSNQGNIICIN